MQSSRPPPKSSSTLFLSFILQQKKNGKYDIKALTQHEDPSIIIPCLLFAWIPWFVEVHKTFLYDATKLNLHEAV